jgi:hypothetical protein
MEFVAHRLGQAGFAGGVAYDMETPGLAVMGRGSAACRLNHAGDGCIGHGVGQETAHGPPALDHGIQVVEPALSPGGYAVD